MLKGLIPTMQQEYLHALVMLKELIPTMQQEFKSGVLWNISF